mgnify:CR=1 FL=1
MAVHMTRQPSPEKHIDPNDAPVTAGRIRPERRRQARIRVSPMHTSVTVRDHASSLVVLAVGHLYDLSPIGARVELDRALDVGRTVQVDLELDDAFTSVSTPARVIRVHDEDDPDFPHRYGLALDATPGSAAWNDLCAYMRHAPLRMRARAA